MYFFSLHYWYSLCRMHTMTINKYHKIFHGYSLSCENAYLMMKNDKVWCFSEGNLKVKWRNWRISSHDGLSNVLFYWSIHEWVFLFMFYADKQRETYKGKGREKGNNPSLETKKMELQSDWEIGVIETVFFQSNSFKHIHKNNPFTLTIETWATHGKS